MCVRSRHVDPNVNTFASSWLMHWCMHANCKPWTWMTSLFLLGRPHQKTGTYHLNTTKPKRMRKVESVLLVYSSTIWRNKCKKRSIMGREHCDGKLAAVVDSIIASQLWKWMKKLRRSSSNIDYAYMYLLEIVDATLQSSTVVMLSSQDGSAASS